ncbi:pneumococcal-type histidine triad protein [Tuanshanicoccus lijuaniae]|uniref:pneumococcal-type histidine triad protein n=1 Tax=Aerococcaceae bacterium zg-1292 TaxID=2774330 RepID=UPI001936E41E|nr:pneumococcal-type histidine triad protein [Aerococcaceae bacterium zg-1292]MBD3949808.1 pneumococcal-type histidine triad protein [Aerococcaceae bacterium zg-1292]MBF6626632.1 pneumococcal-type histidine triad protein [Aerococcaceae bacterium zg-BR9]QQA36948.1 pneumococcal-type histidine triad protein [Aerococcaceae bacterium zg-1292]
MKKRILAALFSSMLLGGAAINPLHAPVFAEETTEHHDEDDHHGDDHDHDHDGDGFEFEADHVVKKDGDKYIVAHGDHYHNVPASELTEEQIKEADEYLEKHPEVTKEYEMKKDVYAGYFEDDQVKDRELSDWEGEWQSVLPYLEDGTLDMVMEKKAKEGKMTAEEYKEYYMKGYKTDVDHITIKDGKMTFKTGDKSVTGEYKYEGKEILKYEKGNRGVRFLFTKVGGDEEAPKSVQFSDHNIAPTKVMHYHIYFGDKSHEELLKEMENWPTYYPAEWSGAQIMTDQLNH